MPQLSCTMTSSEAACLAELSSGEEEFDEQEALLDIMTEVPKNMKRIAGKSLPIEVGRAFVSYFKTHGTNLPIFQKFVSRKARKFVAQGNRLLLPAIEMGYFFGAVSPSFDGVNI
jgi:hypothetical protein